MKIKTQDLIGAALDWAVAKCEDESVRVAGGRVRFALSQFTNDYDLYSPSTNWAQGGPIIEREGINLGTQRNEPGVKPHIDYLWHAQLDQRVYVGYGPTPLIAAMRCYVASKFGDTAEVPKELT